MATSDPSTARRLPAHGWIGLALVAVVWPLNWSLEGNRTHLLFAPLWIGYILTVDGLVLVRTGSSILTRSPALLAQLFLLSAPGWWLFELINARLRNWEYVGRGDFSDLEYALLCTLSFSTVMPAVFESAELIRSFRWIERFAAGPRIEPTARKHALYFALGLAMLAAMLLWPRWFYAFEWTSIVFLLEPICARLRRRSFSAELARGDWRTWTSLWVGCLACGFFWEMWNYWSQPKWIYHVPGVDFARVFEMPILGYLGYLPFAMELWLLAQLVLPRARDLVR